MNQQQILAQALIQDPTTSPTALVPRNRPSQVPMDKRIEAYKGTANIGRQILGAVMGAPSDEEAKRLKEIEAELKNLPPAERLRSPLQDEWLEIAAPYMTGSGTIKRVTDPKLWHPIGLGKQLNKPIDEMTATIDALDNLSAKKTARIEDMQGGVLIPAVGDRSAAGGLLKEVDGRALEQAVKLEGGPDFMRTHAPHGEAWASDKGVTTRIGNQVRSIAEGGRDAFLAYSAMGHKSLGFNTMLSDALVQQLPQAKITKKLAREFDREMKAVVKDWPGVKSEKLQDFLRKSGGGPRITMSETMAKAKYRDGGFPDVVATRKAITEPALLDVPLNASGYAIAKMDPTGAVTQAPSAPHSTYNTHMKGDYIGGLDRSVPREMLFRDFFANREANRPKNFNPKNPGDNRAFMMSDVRQVVDQALVDAISGYLEKQEK